MQSEKVIKEKGHEWMQDNPVGTGPYKLQKWSKKQEHLLVRNDDYWGPKPSFKYVRIRIIPEQATQIAELISGGVDIIKAVPPDQMDVINKSGQARTVDLADPAHGDAAARPGGPLGAEPLPGQARAAGREHGRRHRLDHQARDQRPR